MFNQGNLVDFFGTARKKLDFKQHLRNYRHLASPPMSQEDILHDTGVNQKSNGSFTCHGIFCCQVQWIFQCPLDVHCLFCCQHRTQHLAPIAPHALGIASCHVSNRYQAVRQIAEGTRSQAQPFLLPVGPVLDQSGCGSSSFKSIGRELSNENPTFPPKSLENPSEIMEIHGLFKASQVMKNSGQRLETQEPGLAKEIRSLR